MLVVLEDDVWPASALERLGARRRVHVAAAEGLTATEASEREEALARAGRYAELAAATRTGA